MNLLQELKNDANGIVLITDWLGEGGEPVDKTLATERAKTCVTCPENVAPNWWDKVKDTIADWIKGELELKHKAKLETELDPQLHMCKPCGCCNQLSIWAPAHHIKKHNKLSPEDYPSHCWKKVILT